MRYLMVLGRLSPSTLSPSYHHHSNTMQSVLWLIYSLSEHTSSLSQTTSLRRMLRGYYMIESILCMDFRCRSSLIEEHNLPLNYSKSGVNSLESDRLCQLHIIRKQMD